MSRRSTLSVFSAWKSSAQAHPQMVRIARASHGVRRGMSVAPVDTVDDEEANKRPKDQGNKYGHLTSPLLGYVEDG